MARRIKKKGAVIIWHGPAAFKHVVTGVIKNMAKAAEFAVSKIKRNISISSGGGSSRSQPGEFPHREFSNLVNDIRSEVHVKLFKIVGRVGTNVVYGKFLELGTRKMAARPFMRRTINAERQSINRILGRKI